MKRWCWKRWVWALLFGTAAVVCLTPAGESREGPPGPPRVGDVIPLKFRDGPDRQVKVLKSEKQADGSYLSEVKDMKSGETFTLVDQAPSATPPAAATSTPPGAAPKMPEPPRSQDGPPKAKPRASDPMVPSLQASLPSPKEPEKDRRLLPAINLPAVGKANTAGKPAEPPPEEERPGFLKRVFGRKKPAPEPNTTMPAAAVRPGAAATSPPAPAMPPPLRPTPGTGSTTGEPPRSQPTRPVAPPTPVIPAPVAPATVPPSAQPVPLPLPATPSLPPIGVPNPGGLPQIPVPPSASSAVKPVPPPPPAALPALPALPSAPALPALPTAVKPQPTPVAEPLVRSGVLPAVAQPVTPVRREVMVPPLTPPARAMMQDIEPYTTDLHAALAPSKRATAARALAGCRHGSTDTVKGVLFQAAQNDPSTMVRAVCIEELCKLGYYDPAFMAFLHAACEHKSDEVRAAAKAALVEMTPRR